jgi:hypothetical protein
MVGTKMFSALDAMEQQALAELSTVLGGAALETFCGAGLASMVGCGRRWMR